MATPREQVVGRRFGKLVVLSDQPDVVDSTGRRRRVVRCRCDCGEEADKLLMGVKHRNKKGVLVACSTGCAMVGRPSGNLKHDMTLTKEYKCWLAMRNRCYTPEHVSYKRYGARGITVCDEWRGSFEAFYADMGPAPQGVRISVDRINNDGRYEPGNCRWATPKMQANNRASNILVGGETLSQIADRVGIAPHIVENRFAAGWTLDEITNIPVGNGGSQCRVDYLRAKVAELQARLAEYEP